MSKHHKHYSGLFYRTVKDVLNTGDGLGRIERQPLDFTGFHSVPDGELLVEESLMNSEESCFQEKSRIKSHHCWLMEWGALTDNDPSETVSIVMQSS